jgi:hypothetical protein
VQLERRVEFSSGGVGLEAAWSSDDEDSFRSYVKDHPDYPNSAQAFLEACWRFPRVFAAYQIPRDFDYLAGTKYGGFPRVNAHAPILPHLLTTFSERSGANKRRVFPRQVSVELKDDAGDYRARSTLDGLEVDDDGTLWLTTHREAGLSEPESGTWKGDLGDADTLLPRDLRITLSLQMDHRLCAALSLSGSGAPSAADPNAEAAAVATGTSRQYFASAGSAYVEQLRYGSWPVPQSLDGSTSESDRATDGNELKSDAEKAQAHAQRRLAQVGRVKKTTRLLFPSSMLFRPGQSIAMLDNRGLSTGSFPIRGVVARVIHRYEDNTTEIELT